MTQEQRSLLIRGMGAFAAVLVVLLAVGTLYDYQIAQAAALLSVIAFLVIMMLHNKMVQQNGTMNE